MTPMIAWAEQWWHLARGRSLLFHPKLTGGLYLDEVIGKAALLEGEEIFERSPQPLLIFVRVQQDRHSIMERPDRFVAVAIAPE